jgi:hypothetical protein
MIGHTKILTGFSLISLCVCFIALPLQVQASTCDVEYTIREGDTLSEIVRRTYPSSSFDANFLVQYVYAANQARLENEDTIDVGDTIYLPCPGSGADKGDEDLDEAQIEFAEVTLRRPVDVAFLTATAYPPFADETYPKRGMFPAMIDEVMKFAPSISYHYSFVNDWSAHLQVLLIEQGAFDAAFPWFRPDCEDSARLDANASLRCRFFRFSEPLYEVGVNFYTRADSDIQLNETKDLIDLRICRPAGYFTFDLAERGLLPVNANDGEPKIRLIQPDTPSDCIRLLADDAVDVVTMNALLADAELNKVRGKVALREHPSIASIETLHIIIPKNRPSASALIQQINAAIRQAKSEGIIDEIQENYVRQFYLLNG